VELGNHKVPRDKIYLEVACGVVFGEVCEQILLPSAYNVVGEEDVCDSSINGTGKCRHDGEVNINIPDNVLISEGLVVITVNFSILFQTFPVQLPTFSSFFLLLSFYNHTNIMEQQQTFMI
jgi:hypothetical protein